MWHDSPDELIAPQESQPCSAPQPAHRRPCPAAGRNHDDRGRPPLPKYLRVAAQIRRQIADGTLRPGQPAPSGAELSRAFGFSTLTRRKALRALIVEGLLVPGPSPNARPRVADPQAPDLERDLADAARALSACLAAGGMRPA